MLCLCNVILFLVAKNLIKILVLSSTKLNCRVDIMFCNDKNQHCWAVLNYIVKLTKYYCND